MSITKPTTPVVEAIGRLLITGNVTPHVWYLRSEFRTESNRPDRNMITAVADILYWYRPREVRDEERGGVFVGYERKFARDMLQYDYERRGAIFGMSEREMRESCTKAAKRGLLRIEYRTERFKGKLLQNVVYIEPVPEAIAATLAGPDVGPVEKVKGAKRGRHVKKDAPPEALDPSSGVDDQTPEDLQTDGTPDLNEDTTSQNFGSGLEEAENTPSQNFERGSSQNFEGPPTKFWDTYHESSSETSLSRDFSGGANNVTENARARESEPAAPEQGAPTAPRTTTVDAALSKNVAPDRPRATQALQEHPDPETSPSPQPPDGGAADAANPEGALTDEDFAELLGPEHVSDTDLRKVPPAGPASLTLAALRPVPRDDLGGRPQAVPADAVYKRISALVGGARKLEGYLDEPTPTGGHDRRDWLRLTLEEIEHVKVTAQAEVKRGTLTMTTVCIQALDRLIGAVPPVKPAEAGGENPADVSAHDPKLRKGQRCSVDGRLGVIFAVSRANYIVDRDDGERMTIDRALARQLKRLKASAEPVPAAPVVAPAQPDTLGAVGTTWTPKAGGAPLTVVAVEGATRVMSDETRVPVYQLTSKFERVC